jgi:hypothetical protein
MKVSSTPSTATTSASGAARPAAEGFGDLLGAGAPAPRVATSAVSGAAGVSGVSALMALQGVGGPEARARALRKGRRMLDALDRLQVALLGEGLKGSAICWAQVRRRRGLRRPLSLARQASPASRR